MAQETTTRIIEIIQSDKSARSVKELKQEMSDIRDYLVSADEASGEYAKAVEKLRDDQDKLNKVMGVTKKDADAVAGSYNALVKEMSDLKKEWKSTGDAIERAKIGEKIKGINDQLKEMDASIGNYQRNVGSYEEALKNWTPTLKDALGGLGRVAPLFGEASGAVESFDKALKLMSTNPAGAWMMGLVAVVQMANVAIKALGGSTEEAEKKITSMRESFARQNASLDLNVRVASATGASSLETAQMELAVIKEQMKEVQREYDNAKYYYENLSGVLFAKGGYKKTMEETAKMLEDLAKRKKELQDDITVETARLKYEEEKRKAEEAQKGSGSIATTATSDNSKDQAQLLAIQEEIRIAQLESNEARELDALTRSYEEKIALFMQYNMDVTDLEVLREEGLAQIRAKYREQEKNEWTKQFAEELRDLERKTDAELKIEQAKSRTEQMLSNLEESRRKQRLGATASFLDSMSSLAGESTAAGKAMSVASALISTYSSAQMAYESAFLPVPTPASPVIAALNMAAAIASGIANVKQILSVDAENGETGASVGNVSVQAPAVIQQTPVTRTITEGVDEDALNQMQSTQRVVLVYSDVEAAGRKVNVQNTESSF